MNLRNLYELFINHNHDEPKKKQNGGAAFTTQKAMLHCASCSQGVQNFNTSTQSSFAPS